jgi:hypothetical protein
VFKLECGHFGYYKSNFVRLPEYERERIAAMFIVKKQPFLCPTCNSMKTAKHYVGVMPSDKAEEYRKRHEK